WRGAGLLILLLGNVVDCGPRPYTISEMWLTAEARPFGISEMWLTREGGGFITLTAGKFG
ncbi:hypothetical protein, partial [Limnospira sp. PMC 1042.18]|uniref:hypothetical protein n=1 Tax=Limnospira sp. PMC 1042.18 TaxID=2981018 RepID=UPI0028E12127